MKYQAERSPEITSAEKEHMDLVRTLAEECMVLLENDGTLPLKAAGKIALFGNGARATVKGGTGSGDVNSRFVVNVEQGLSEAGFTVTTKRWLDEQEKAAAREKLDFKTHLEERARRENTTFIAVSLDEHFLSRALVPVTEEDVKNSDTNIALYVLSRNSGEGADRENIPGDYRLLQEEIDTLTYLGSKYEKFLVFLNIGGMIHMPELTAIPGINTILFMGQLGNLTGSIVADVLLGKSIPSGRLTDTWAANYEDHPSSANFSHNNGDIQDEYYNDGIFMGYRYFDSFNVTPVYPFGFGRNYTEFSMEPLHLTIEGEIICLLVRVKNTGSVYSGRETVQVYASAPHGELDKPYQVLVGFAKTGSLEPGQEEVVKVSFSVRNLESFSEDRAAYILEAGTYYIRVGNHSRNTHVAAGLVLGETVITRQVKNLFALDCELPTISSKGQTPYSYEGEEEEKAKAPRFVLSLPETITAFYSPAPVLLKDEIKDHVITMGEVKAGRYTMEELVAQLSLEEMTELCVGTDREVSASVVGNSGKRVPGAAGDTTSRLAYRGVRDMLNADGPAGIRLTPHFRTDAKGNRLPGGDLFGDFIEPLGEKQEGDIDYYQYCTAIPIATMLASSWNMELIQKFGDILGEEMERFGVCVLLGPGMNLHRNPLCGRNFEYYSEDPLLSGSCAASMVKGIQAHEGIAACPKHYAGNNQEDNRMFINIHIGERALRELYLRNFAITIEEAKPLTIMTSYNLLNGTHTANHYDLLTSFARDEYGFGGYFMTDWFSSNDRICRAQAKPDPKYDSSSAAMCVYAGNDIQMPGGQVNIDDIRAAVEDGNLPVPYLQQCCIRLLKVNLVCGDPN